MLMHQRTCQPCSQHHHHKIDLHNYLCRVKPRSRNELVIKCLIAFPIVSPLQWWRKPEISSRRRTEKDREGQRRFSLLKTSSSAITEFENILVCLTSEMFCRTYLCFPDVSFDAGNSNGRSGFQTLSMNQNFFASVNEAMTLYTVSISVSEQSSFRLTGSLESSDAMTRHSDRVVHD